MAKVSHEPSEGPNATKAAVPAEKAYALEDVTALFYSESRNEIYTGRSDGRLHVWGN